MTRLAALPAFVLVASAALAAADGGVALNGTSLPRATTTIDATQDISELREGGSPTIQLIPSLKRYGICIVSAGPVAALDAELPLADSPSRFTVRAEDGREFGQCLLASLKADGVGGKRRLTYCLRCENVGTPTP